MLAGSYAGSYLPMLWGDSAFSMASLFFGTVGGFLGIWIAYNISVKYF